ncbi:4-diphosphocytidyl-2-C-methyl-D-erythritol kinase [Candidatus Hartigia pinicola]|nr:4-diphosphocytidyl-2-C-methyl-D-erythritol kinase [Candidatus Hartigia pinicola]
MTLTWPSPAKLNLFLYIISRRSDDYHELQTLFQFLNYSDKIMITTRNDSQINLLTSMQDIDPKKNLIIKAARLLQKYCYDNKLGYQANLGADIRIRKILPIGAGIGGGSSNAATIFIALNTHWESSISDDILAELGISLGADIPIFIQGKAAFSEGIGEILTPVFPQEKWYLVTHPKIKILTSKIFQDPELNRNSEKRSLVSLLQTPYFNDCEPIARKRFYKIEQLASWLLQYAPSRLTGTGACFFSEFKTQADALKILNKTPSWVHGFVAQGINESPLHKFRAGITDISH